MKAFIQKVSPLWWTIVISFFFTTIFLSDYVLNLDKPPNFTHNDVMLISAIIKHYVDTFFRGNFQDILTLPFFYGFGNSVLLSEHYFIYGLAALPIYLFKPDMVFVFNVLATLSVAGNFFSMFVFTHYLTKKVGPSAIAATIFAFNPFVMSHFPDIIIYYTLVWIPLIFLYVEKSLKNPTSVHIFLVFFFLICQTLTTMTYTVFLSLILPIYFLIRVRHLRIPLMRFINGGALLGLLLFVGICLGLFNLYASFYTGEPIGRTITETSFYSAWVSDYLFSPQTSLLYGNFRRVALNIIPSFIFDAGELAEHNVFWGLTPLLLFILSFKIAPKSGYRKFWLLCLGLLILSVLLSFGPYIHLTYTLYVPGPYYLLYALHPLFDYLRVASRFGVFSYFFLALITAFVMTSIMVKFSKKTGYALCLFVALLILGEYWNKPFVFGTIADTTRAFYAGVDAQKDINVLLELPMGNLSGGVSQAQNQYVDAAYIFYATNVHAKKLLNGYSGVIPLEYQKRQQYLSINFPTSSKLRQLTLWGIDGIVLHKDLFKDPTEFDHIRSKLKNLGVKEVLTNDNEALFSLIGWSVQ